MESHAPADAAERYRYARAMLLANLTSVLALTALAASLITARAELAIETVATRRPSPGPANMQTREKPEPRRQVGVTGCRAVRDCRPG